MEEFRKKITEMDDERRRIVLRNVVNLMRQHQQHEIGDAFYDVLSCYPSIPFNKNEREFRLFLAWDTVYQFEKHHLVRQILSQPI